MMKGIFFSCVAGLFLFLTACKPKPFLDDSSYAKLIKAPLSLSFDSVLAYLGFQKSPGGNIRSAGLVSLESPRIVCAAFSTIAQALRFIEKGSVQNTQKNGGNCKGSSPWIVYQVQWRFQDPWEGQKITGLRFQALPGSARIYLNQDYLGELGRIEEAIEKEQKGTTWIPMAPAWIPVSPGSLEGLKKNTIFILLQGGHYPTSKLGEIQLGSHYAHYQRNDFRMLWIGFLFGISLIASFFNFIFFLLSKRYTHLFAALIPGLFCLHVLPWLIADFAYPARFQGFDTAIFFGLLPAFVFLFYRHLYSPLFYRKNHEKAKVKFIQNIQDFVRGIGQGYVLYLGFAIAFYLTLSQRPVEFQAYLFWFFWVYLVPTAWFVVLLLGLAIYHGLPAALPAFLSTTLFCAGLLVDAFALAQSPFMRLGTLFFAMFAFILQFILILAVNRYRTLQESHKARKILQETRHKLKEAEKQKNQYILASARQLQFGLQGIAQKIVQLLDEGQLFMSKKYMAVLSSILHECRSLQKQSSRAELLFDDLEMQDIPLNLVDLIDLLDYFSLFSESKQQGIEMQIDVQTEIKEEALHILANRNFLLHLLHELLDNTIKHSPKPRVFIQLKRNTNCLQLIWHDKGLARQARRLGNFLSPFSKGNKGTHSLGLGLSLVHRIAELHGHPLEILADGSLLFQFKLQQKIYKPKQEQAILHIAFLYQAGRHKQAIEEILNFEKQKPKPIFRLLFGFKKADAINRFLRKHEDFLKLHRSFVSASESRQNFVGRKAF